MPPPTTNCHIRFERAMLTDADQFAQLMRISRAEAIRVLLAAALTYFQSGGSTQANAEQLANMAARWALDATAREQA